MQVNHIDGDKTNNRANNLEYTTPSDNVRHSLSVLGRKRASGERVASSKLTAKQVVTIRQLWSAGLTTRTAIAQEYGVSLSTICRVVSGELWHQVGIESQGGAT